MEEYERLRQQMIAQKSERTNAYHAILKNSSCEEFNSFALLYVPCTHSKDEDAGARIPKGPVLADLGPPIPKFKGIFTGWKRNSMAMKSLTSFGFMFDSIVVRNSTRFTTDPGPKDPLK